MSDSNQEESVVNNADTDKAEIQKNQISAQENAEGTGKPENSVAKESSLSAEDSPRQGSGKNKKIIGGIIGGIGVALVAVYIGIALFYNTHFFPGTTINGIPCGNDDISMVREKWDDWAHDYTISVVGRDLQTKEKVTLAVLGANDFDWTELLDEGKVKAFADGQNMWLWPRILEGKSYPYQIEINADYDPAKIKSFLDEIDAFKAVNMTAPKDATIRGYSDTDRKIVLEPEVEGTLLELNKVYQVVGDAAKCGKVVVDIEEQGCYVEPKVTVEAPALKRSIASANRWLQTSIVYDWNGAEVILDADQIKEWVTLENGVFILNEEAIAEYVTAQAKEHDTYKKHRRFQTTLGYELDLPGGAFGWLTDKETETKALTNLIKCGAMGNREPEYERTAPVKGVDDIGSSYVEADLTHQHLYLYQDGELVLETDFVSGNMSNGNKTPEGVFGLTYKTKNAILRGPNYASHVNYWMPFNGNVGMHDATWRSQFGGEIYKTSGSHGCINLPLSKAAEIYPYVSKGFPVICYYYPEGMLPADERKEQDAVAVSGEAAENEGAAEPVAPAEGQPAEGQPAEGQPAEGQPAEGQPAEGQPAEGQPAEGQQIS